MRRGQLGMDAEQAAIRPWMACGGGPPEQCRSEGTPSLGEAPDAGAESLWLLWAPSKVTRCKSGTLSGRTRSNGYVPQTPRHIPHPDFAGMAGACWISISRLTWARPRRST
ncbi:hypothetical protein DWF74_26790 [Pseudomonas protegens]|nr:hypothetical protein DWF74_26790 [Pseudomonas protegens]